MHITSFINHKAFLKIMEIINKDEFKINKEAILRGILNGATFIHPTDTIYGIGCNARHFGAVKKVREAKQRYTRPFSIIAPSKEWIRENCEVSKEAEKWINKLPGPYTLILKLKKKDAVSPNVNSDLDTLGIRIPNHWFSEVAAELNAPIVTTSANVIGKDFMTSLDNLDPEIKVKIDFILYEGEKKGRPSTIIDLTDNEKVIKR